MSTPADIKLATAVVQVGEGRGFIIATKHARYVVTAAHCIFDKLPAPHPARFAEEVTFKNLIGRLGGKRQVWAECLFVDPIADIAVFGAPAHPDLDKQATAYKTLTGKAAFRLERPSRLPREAVSEARMLSLDGEWFTCRITSRGESIWFDQAAQPVIGGMSGSPIVLPDGSAVGVVCTSTAAGQEGGPNPMLAANLPGWLVEEALHP